MTPMATLDYRSTRPTTAAASAAARRTRRVVLAPALTAILPGVLLAASGWGPTWSRSGRIAGLAMAAAVTSVGFGLAVRLTLWRGGQFCHAGLVLIWANLIETGVLCVAALWAAAQ